MPKCIVIGAGPGGLVCTKELLEAGVKDVVCLESSQKIGGLFNESYDSLFLTSSAAFSMFSDFWIGDGEAHAFWTKEKVVDYWQRYADHFSVSECIRFGACVRNAEQIEGAGWRVELESGEILTAQHLVVATGNNKHPVYPTWHTDLKAIKQVHSRDYQNADAFRGKRVLVVGGGESASDLALEIAKVADQCWVSLRNGTGWVIPRNRAGVATDMSTHRGLWMLPRSLGPAVSKSLMARDERLGASDPAMAALVELNKSVPNAKGIWGTYGTKTFSLPLAIANHGCVVVGEIVEVKDTDRALTASDGTVLEDVDFVVFATGYRSHVPFLNKPLSDVDPRALFKHMSHPDFGTDLFWIGFARPAFGSQFPIMEMQARYCARLVSGKTELPSSADMASEIVRDRTGFLAQFEATGERVRGLVDYFKYMNDLARLLECAPPLWRYAVTRPRLWLHLVYGPMQATQFRLVGPGAKPGIARKIILQLPVSKFNKVVRIGLQMRLKNLLGMRRHAD